MAAASQSVTLSPQALAILRRLRTLPAVGLQAAARAMEQQNTLTVSHIQRDYLSFPSDGPVVAQGLRVQTGSLRRSVRASRALIAGQMVTSSIGGNVTRRGVNYLAVHEYGAHHPARPPRAGAKRSRPRVGAWDAPARGMIQRGIADRLPEYGRALSGAIVDTLEGRA
jgi:hypothetical protein